MKKQIKERIESLVKDNVVKQQQLSQLQTLIVENQGRIKELTAILENLDKEVVADGQN
jgi:uncharacterized protein (DUF1015 family)